MTATDIEPSTEEVLTKVKGLGPTKRELLLKEFGSVESVLQASRGDLAAVQGISPDIAKRIKRLSRNMNSSTPKKRKRQSAKAKPGMMMEGAHSVRYMNGELVIMTDQGEQRFPLARQSAILDLYEDVREGAQDYVSKLNI